ncbi:hypothetical protein CCHR01_02324 [Colletotrichum chrysophilum]|uniref:Uncharacterized protein n=1 Tax=Colletotrichum chrysophilum TaxID=1836956 RepID=A0AAD9AX96_9PEZI|nr:hypothetical protein CCHR01_02324 [Colletotrichum chrysophilum]
MSGPVEYNQMPREPAPAMIVEPNHSEQPRLVEPMKMEQSTSLRGGKADGGSCRFRKTTSTPSSRAPSAAVSALASAASNASSVAAAAVSRLQRRPDQM